MAKKVFLQKGAKSSGGGSRSHVKILLWSAVALIVLVVVAPLITKDKKSKDVSKKPEAEKGVVVKEIPRALQLMQEDALSKSEVPRDIFEGGEVLPGSPGTEGTPPETGTATVPAPYPGEGPDPSVRTLARGDEGRGVPGEQGMGREVERPASDPALTGEPWEKSMAMPSETAMRTAPDISDPSRPLPESTGISAPPTEPPKVPPAEATGQIALQSPAPAKPAAAKPAPVQPEKPKPTPREGPLAYTVQVGSFKEKSNALELKKNLEKKGYQVVVRPMNHPTLGQLHVVQLKPVPDLAKASTLVEQIKMEAKVTPVVVRVPRE